MNKTISLNMNLNALQLTLIAVRAQLVIETQGQIISDHAERNVSDLKDTSEQLKTLIEDFKTNKK